MSSHHGHGMSIQTLFGIAGVHAMIGVQQKKRDWVNPIQDESDQSVLQGWQPGQRN